MSPDDTPASQTPDELLASLDEADAALRALYRELVEDPDLASAHESRLQGLHAKRVDLAQRVGLAMLALRRAAPTIAVAPPPEPANDDASATDDEVEATPTGEPNLERSEPRADRASDAALAQWKSVVRSTGLGVRLGASPSEHTAWSFVLHELMEAVRPPRSLDLGINAIDEVDALDAVSTDERQENWTRLPRRVQQLWLSTLVARTRALKELPSVTAETKGRAQTIIARYPKWAKEHVPGHVNGLQLKHEPLHGSWSRDALHLWGELADLLGEEVVARSPVSPKKRPKRSGDEPNADQESAIDPAWPLLPHVRGRAAIMVGGDPREPNRERIESVFQLASLEWPAIDGPRKVDAVAGRVRNGTYGLVLVLKPFVAHKEAVPIIEAARSTATLWALVDGYGITAVKVALERFLGKESRVLPLVDGRRA